MSLYYAGLDVSDLKTAICVIDAKGKCVAEAEADTTPAAVSAYLKPYRRGLRAVGHEASAKATWLYKELRKRRFPAVCIDARVASGPLGAQRNKTDQNDARGIAQIVRSGWYTTAHVKSDEAARLRLLLNFRKTMKRSAIRLETTLRMSVKMFGASVQRKGSELVMKQAARRPDPLLVKMSKTLVRPRASLLAEVEQLDEALAKAAKADPVCRRLMTVPGVGPLTALAFKAAVDDPARFRSSRAVGAYFGLTPRRRQSGQMDVSGHISRMGDETVRTALYSAAFVLLTVSKSKCPLRAWGLRLKEEKGTKRATVAVARKLAVIMHRMWLTGRDFDAAHLRAPA